MKTITATLQDAIEHSGETVYAIAQRAGITQASLYRFVTGERGLTLESADKLAAYFRLELKPAATKRKNRAGA